MILGCNQTIFSSNKDNCNAVDMESHQQICPSATTDFDENSAKEIQMPNGNLKEGKSHCSGLKHGMEKALQRYLKGPCKT
jgi:hypothetical protein